jgi:Spy/CpxP family protein refolding chaperone
VKIWKVILATLVIFGAGVVTGGLLVSHVDRVNRVKPKSGKPAPTPSPAVNPWNQRSRDLLKRMERELNLTPEQREHIEKIIAESQERTKALWRPIAPQMNKEMLKVREEIREQLTPEQLKKFDDLSKPRQQLKKSDDHRHSTTDSPSLEAPGTNTVSTNTTPLGI